MNTKQKLTIAVLMAVYGVIGFFFCLFLFSAMVGFDLDASTSEFQNVILVVHFVIAIIGIILSCIYFSIVKKEFENEKTPYSKIEESIKVKVVNKIEKNIKNYVDPFPHIVFEKENGERLTFIINEDLFNEILVNDEGILTYKNRTFISFIRNSN